MLRRGLDAGDVDAVTSLQVEKVNKMELATGDIAKRFWPGPCPGAMFKPAKPLIEERCSAVSLDGRAIGEKVFEHDRVSLFVRKTGSCHAG